MSPRIKAKTYLEPICTEGKLGAVDTNGAMTIQRET
jgi:hypothetical protein